MKSEAVANQITGTVQDPSPGILRKIWEAWKRVGQFIGDFIARLILSVFYFTLFAPFGLGVRLFGDRLNVKNKARSSWWMEKKLPEPALEEARRQF